MLIMPQKKKIASIFISKLSSQPSEGESKDFVQRMGEESDSDEYETPGEDYKLAKESAASSIISALEAKDAKALAQALSEFISVCEASEKE